jgi:hypothetical protein
MPAGVPPTWRGLPICPAPQPDRATDRLPGVGVSGIIRRRGPHFLEG